MIQQIIKSEYTNKRQMQMIRLLIIYKLSNSYQSSNIITIRITMWESDNEELPEESSLSYLHTLPNLQPPHTRLHQILQVNVAIYRDILGLTVSPDSFRLRKEQEEPEMQPQSDSERQYDYDDCPDDHLRPEEDDDPFQNDDSSSSSSPFQRQFSDDSFGLYRNQQSSYSSNSSPYFPPKEGMSQIEISALPTMEWNKTHDLFNKGEKCPICLDEFQVGHFLRVMDCLHRFHSNCLDQWLSMKASCPSCRNAQQ